MTKHANICRFGMACGDHSSLNSHSWGGSEPERERQVGDPKDGQWEPGRVKPYASPHHPDCRILLNPFLLHKVHSLIPCPYPAKSVYRIHGCTLQLFWPALVWNISIFLLVVIQAVTSRTPSLIAFSTQPSSPDS